MLFRRFDALRTLVCLALLRIAVCGENEAVIYTRVGTGWCLDTTKGDATLSGQLVKYQPILYKVGTEEEELKEVCSAYEACAGLIIRTGGRGDPRQAGSPNVRGRSLGSIDADLRKY